MSDVNFINAYNEVILENLNAIMKQNFMFQTQIRFLEEKVKLIPEMEEKLDNVEKDKSAKQEEYNRLVSEKSNLDNEVNSLKSELDNKNSIIQNNITSDNDKHRLQTAVNNQMKEIETLKETIDDLKKRQKEQQEYVTQLEEMLPNSKKKKLGIEISEELKPIKEEPKTLNNEDDNLLKFASTGGTF